MHASLNPAAVACTLSPGDYAERLREFRRLFATALRAYQREPTRLRLVIGGDAPREAAVRDLLRRERECCPFFAFTVERTDDAIVVVAEVPAGDDVCLDDLERMAARATAGRRA
jgi:hypothetical protein